MIPSTWLPHHRDDDDELIGYLAPSGDEWLPTTLFGLAVDEPCAEQFARQALDELGLSYLIEPWLLTDDEGTQVRVSISEVSPSHVSVLQRDVALAMGNPDVDMSRAIVLEVPTNRLQPERPLR